MNDTLGLTLPLLKYCDLIDFAPSAVPSETPTTLPSAVIDSATAFAVSSFAKEIVFTVYPDCPLKDDPIQCFHSNSQLWNLIGLNPNIKVKGLPYLSGGEKVASETNLSLSHASVSLNGGVSDLAVDTSCPDTKLADNEVNKETR